jgi:hypothetical protein
VISCELDLHFTLLLVALFHYLDLSVSHQMRRRASCKAVSVIYYLFSSPCIPFIIYVHTNAAPFCIHSGFSLGKLSCIRVSLKLVTVPIHSYQTSTDNSRSRLLQIPWHYRHNFIYILCIHLAAIYIISWHLERLPDTNQIIVTTQRIQLA